MKKLEVCKPENVFYFELWMLWELFYYKMLTWVIFVDSFHTWSNKEMLIF